MKTIAKIIFPMLSLFVGIFVMIEAMPYAKGFRANPNLIGGECLIPLFFLGGYFFILAIIKALIE